MKWHRSDALRDIAARARPLWQREAGDRDPVAGLAEKRFERWQRIIGAPPVMARRLRSAPVAGPALHALLGGAHSDDAPLPPWVSTLDRVVRDVHGNRHDRAFDAAKPLPFEHVLLPFVRDARSRVECAGVLEPEARVAMERQLLAHLSFVAALTLGRELYEYRFARAPLSAIESIWASQPASTELYDAWVSELRLLELFERYPVLARLLSQSADQWVSNTTRFCERFAKDFDASVLRVRTDLSDRHHGGQSVIECELSNGERVIYKPRTVAPEIAFFRLIAALPLDLKVLRAIDRGTYGWVEAAVAAPCDEAGVERFYERAGMLLAILHLLAATDMHFENLIAAGEHPVIVDLETMLNEGSAEHSVASTGMLPRDGVPFDLSALGADGKTGTRMPAWQRVNTDQMTFGTAPVAPSPATHLPRATASVADHAGACVRGFERAYACLLARRDALLADDALLAAFDDLDLRVLVRNTTTYSEMHQHALHPEHLQDGIDRSIQFEWLARPLSATDAPRPGRIRLYELEVEAMESLDIPRFDVRTWRAMRHDADDRDIVALCGDRDSRMLRRRLRALSSADCARQVAILREAIEGRATFRSPEQIAQRHALAVALHPREPLLEFADRPALLRLQRLDGDVVELADVAVVDVVLDPAQREALGAADVRANCVDAALAFGAEEGAAAGRVGSGGGEE